jgi:hypothetical protein
MTNSEQRQLNVKTVKKCRLILIGCALVILSLSLVKLVLSNRAATWGEELESIEVATQNLKKSNQELQLLIKQKNGSLIQLVQEAEMLGFVNKPQYLYLSPTANVAQNTP